MYCPTCAAQNEAGVKFCRSCGQDLILIEKALTKSGPVMLLGQISKEIQEAKERQKQPRITRGLYWTGISIVFFGLWCLRLYQHGDFGAVVLGLVHAFMFLGIGIREFVRYLVSERGDEKLLPASPQQWGRILDLAPSELANKKSPRSAGPIPTVTESTTRQLDAKHQGSRDTKATDEDCETIFNIIPRLSCGDPSTGVGYSNAGEGGDESALVATLR